MDPCFSPGLYIIRRAGSLIGYSCLLGVSVLSLPGGFRFNFFS